VNTKQRNDRCGAKRGFVSAGGGAYLYQQKPPPMPGQRQERVALSFRFLRVDLTSGYRLSSGMLISKLNKSKQTHNQQQTYKQTNKQMATSNGAVMQ
jgi:hypothetical protein